MSTPAPWSNPTTPNLADYFAFVGTQIENLLVNLPFATGTATAGTATTLTDSTQTWATGQWVNYYLDDETAGFVVPVSASTASVLTFATQANAAAADDTYLIVPPIVNTSFQVALSIVNDALSVAGTGTYVLAVYNLALDRLVNYAPDQAGQSYFQRLRAAFHLVSTSVGAVSSASDQGTSASIVNPDWMRNMTMRDIQTLKTPWGREYMGLAQAYGPTVWVSV